MLAANSYQFAKGKYQFQEDKIRKQAKKNSFSEQQAFLSLRSRVLENALNQTLLSQSRLTSFTQKLVDDQNKYSEINRLFQEKKLLFHEAKFYKELDFAVSKKDQFSQLIIWKTLLFSNELTMQKNGEIKPGPRLNEHHYRFSLLSIFLPALISNNSFAMGQGSFEGPSKMNYGLIYPNLLGRHDKSLYPGYSQTETWSFRLPNIVKHWIEEKRNSPDENVRVIITPFYKDVATSKPVLSLINPIWKKGNEREIDGQLITDLFQTDFKKKYQSLLSAKDGLLVWHNDKGAIFNENETLKRLFSLKPISPYLLPSTFNRFITQYSFQDSSINELKELSCESNNVSKVRLGNGEIYHHLCKRLVLEHPFHFVSAEGISQSVFYLSYFVPDSTFIKSAQQAVSGAEDSFQNKFIFPFLLFIIFSILVSLVCFGFLFQIAAKTRLTIRNTILYAYKGEKIQSSFSLAGEFNTLIQRITSCFYELLKAKESQELVIKDLKNNTKNFLQVINQSLNRFSFSEFRIYDQSKSPEQIRVAEIVYSLNSEFRGALDELSIVESFNQKKLEDLKEDFNFYFFLQNYFEFLQLYRADYPFKIKNELTFDDNLVVPKEYLQHFLLSLFRKINLLLFFDSVLLQSEETSTEYKLSIRFEGLQPSELFSKISNSQEFAAFLKSNVQQIAGFKTKSLEKISAKLDTRIEGDSLILHLVLYKTEPQSAENNQQRYINIFSVKGFSDGSYVNYLSNTSQQYEVFLISDKSYERSVFKERFDYHWNTLNSLIQNRIQEKRIIILYESVSQSKHVFQDYQKLSDQNQFDGLVLIHADSNYFHKMSFGDHHLEFQNISALLPENREVFMAKVFNRIQVQFNRESYELPLRIHELNPSYEDFETNNLNLIRSFSQNINEGFIYLGYPRYFENNQLEENIIFLSDEKFHTAVLRIRNSIFNLIIEKEEPFNEGMVSYLQYAGNQLRYFEDKLYDVSRNRNFLIYTQKLLKRVSSIVYLKKTKTNKIEIFYLKKQSLVSEIYPVPFDIVYSYLRNYFELFEERYLFNRDLLKKFISKVSDPELKYLV